jgi:tRNA 2-thiouridine synthesizing protein A
MKFEKISDDRFMLDVKGYVCPHPQIYTKKALSKIESGNHLEVVFDNPSSGESIAAMCDITGDEIIDRKQEGGAYIWDIEKA